ncbi:DUF58 domain-containing protein [Thermonema rossianum]|uniref:DUF58 domain-containing protein n=1 Tax=Thermonema rossianum TaxID=55505 RepID=UPI000691E370|nr:DUF58 domain-containing protein [Thermonema rossianum]
MQEHLHHIVAKIKKIELSIRRNVFNELKGNYRSFFKGSGLEFTALREYQYGDDVRYIDWMASAKGHGVFLKEYKEERELSVYILLDMSASMAYPSMQKWQTAREIAAVLMWLSLRERCEVTLLGAQTTAPAVFPALRKHHALMAALERLWGYAPAQEDAYFSWQQACRRLRRHSVVIVVSDFIHPLRQFRDLGALLSFHELYLVHLFDESHYSLPPVGVAPAKALEAPVRQYLYFNKKQEQEAYRRFFEQRCRHLDALVKRGPARIAHVHTGRPYERALSQLFIQL